MAHRIHHAAVCFPALESPAADEKIMFWIVLQNTNKRERGRKKESEMNKRVFGLDKSSNVLFEKRFDIAYYMEIDILYLYCHIDCCAMFPEV